MRDNERKEFCDLAHSVWSFYRQTLTPMMTQILWQALRGYDLQAISKAFDKHLMNPDTGQFPPKPADIVRLLDGGTEDQAQLAWAKVDKAVRQVGAYQSVVFDDAVIHAVLMDMGGWIALGNCTEDEWPFKAREFEKRYRGYTLRGMVQYQRQLTGIAEAQNQQAGRQVQPPIMFGDAGRCRLVYQGGQDRVVPLMRAMSADDLKPALALVRE